MGFEFPRFAGTDIAALVKNSLTCSPSTRLT